ncbi:hypothetical protein DFS34DRAFT_391434 [Phlyctochytrium arcticum]|nr:hypothetical protein DFS34DRAFT_391434 [Phlyctochytrium arcticum]
MEPKPQIDESSLLVTKIPPTVSLTGIYSATGFDLLGLLSRIIHRPNPVIPLGPIDTSCAFLVTDPRKPDNPVIYASDTFTKLTGYSVAEVVHRNCRFLQSPDGIQEKGGHRRFTDHTVVTQLKLAVDRGEECQFTLINYKKNGEPFINLVTMVPVEYHRPGEISYYVGLQVDLIDQPQAILNQMKDGTYSINYQIAEQLDARPPDSSPFLQEANDATPQSQRTPIVSELGAFPENIEELVEDFGDFVHILSLRGLFLYVAPQASQRLLEYNADELMGRNLHEFIHPADYISVIRELRTTSPGDTVNFICRFRRKFSGYVYLEVNGHIYEGDSNKRTKCFIMSGREKQVGVLLAKDILLPDREMSETWAKLSVEGMILYISPNCASVVGQTADELTARSLVELLHDGDVSLFLDAVKRGYSPVVIRMYADRSPVVKTIFCQIKVIEPDGTDPLDLKTLSEYQNLYEDGNLFDVMNEVRPTSLHYELNQMRIHNKHLREELESLLAPSKRKVKPRPEVSRCAQCQTSYSPEWRKGPDNQRNLCNACGLRYAKASRTKTTPTTS